MKYGEYEQINGVVANELSDKVEQLEDEVLRLRESIVSYMDKSIGSDRCPWLMEGDMNEALAENGVKLMTTIVDGKYLLINCI